MERFKIWKFTIHQTIKGETVNIFPNGRVVKYNFNPMFGMGLGNFFTTSPMSQFKMYGLDKSYVDGKIKHYYEHTHNDLVEAFYEFGYIGLFILLITIGSVVLTFARSIKTSSVVITFSSLVAQSVASMSVYIFHAPVSLFMICLTLGLFYSEVTNANKSQIQQTA